MMNPLRRFLLAAVWALLAFPVDAQVAGFTGTDGDHDGLPDDFEQAVLDKFRPTWKISASDCNGLPAEFVPGVATPTVKSQNGTIYGQVFLRDRNALGFFVEAHFYDLWAEDCGYINSHPLDAEHVSVLIRAIDPSLPLTEWHASQWYAAAHEDTLCDSSQIASAAVIDAEDHGATVWIARGKHGAFFSQQVCSIGGCGLDRCEAATVTLTSSPVNLGEPNMPLNGAIWAASSRWPGPLTAKMRTDFPSVFSFSSLVYSFANRGGMSLSTTGSPLSTVIGYALVQTTEGSPPAGVSLFSVRRNNVLVTEAGVPASAPIDGGRFYAEVGNSVNTGLAIANPNSQPAIVSFFLTNAQGVIFRQGTLSVPAKGLLGRFLDEAPFNTGSFGKATLTFTASLPVAVTALRGFTNQRGDFLITTLPVSPLSSSKDRMLVFPQLADGGGWTTQLVLVNPTDEVLGGSVQFLAQGGSGTPAGPLEVALNGQTGSTFPYRIAPGSFWYAKTAGSGIAANIGSVRIAPEGSQVPPAGVAIFSFQRSGVVVTETGVPAVPAKSAFRLFAEASGNFAMAEPGSLQTGIAIANALDTPATLTLELTTLAGVTVGFSRSLTIPAQGQIAMFLSELPGFSSIPSPFQGQLRILAGASDSVSVTGLRGRYNERRDFLLAATPVTNENIGAPDADTLFPYLADGAGYTTQFILSSAADGASSGWLRFYAQSGTPLSLALK
jgi:hypothetical protein